MSITALLLMLSPSTCNPIAGWQTIAAESKDKVLVFGETHGSKESPKAVEEYVCKLLENGESLLLGVEFDRNTNAGFQKAWREPHDKFRKHLFDNVPSWGQRLDGVASEAMLNMLIRLHKLKSEGADINITAFNGTRDAEQKNKFRDLAGQGSHEAAQAENIYLASIARPYDHIVVLVGSLHAQTVQEDWDGAIFDPMAKRLAKLRPVLTLKQQYAGGESWNCRIKLEKLEDHDINHQDITEDDIICGPSAALSDKQVYEIPQMGLWSAASGERQKGYDGYYFVGPITASPPAKR